jgi:hypothetical protein
MLIISHRGNLKGPQPQHENRIDYLENALNEGFNVEFDIWMKGKDLYLGHDYPTYYLKVKDYRILFLKKVWVHAKNLQALNFLIKRKINCFYHKDDKSTLTSNKFMWMFPVVGNFPRAIFVLPELKKNLNLSKSNFKGVCTDYCFYYEKKFKK